jgi:hypothetical protein
MQYQVSHLDGLPVDECVDIPLLEIPVESRDEFEVFVVDQSRLF